MVLGDPGAAGYLFEVAFAGVSLAIVWGAMAERAKLWVYFAFGIWFTLTYSVVSHWIWSPHGWLFKHGMQDFAGSTVVHYQGALAALAGALILGPRIGKFGSDGRANPIPGHNIPFAVLGTIILWFGWFGFNPGSTLSVDFGGFGYFAYVALTTNIAAAAGAVTGMCVAWARLGKPDISMMLNGTLGALVAITAASGFVAPWAAIVIGVGSGFIAVFGVILVERIKIDDPIGAVAVHGMSGVWGTLATGLFAVPALADKLATGKGGLVYTGSFHQLGIQALGLLAVGAFGFATSFGALYVMHKLWGIRVEASRRNRRPRRPRTRHVGLPRVLHPRPRRLRHRIPRPCRRRLGGVARAGRGSSTDGRLTISGCEGGGGIRCPASSLTFRRRPLGEAGWWTQTQPRCRGRRAGGCRHRPRRRSGSSAARLRPVRAHGVRGAELRVR